MDGLKLKKKRLEADIREEDERIECLKNIEMENKYVEGELRGNGRE